MLTKGNPSFPIILLDLKKAIWSTRLAFIISVEKNEKTESAFQNNLNYICNETLAKKLIFSSRIENHEKINLIDEISCNVLIEKQ